MMLGSKLPRQHLAAVLLVPVGLVCCPLDVQLYRCWPECGERTSTDAAEAQSGPSWGEYAATLDVPDCPASSYPPLVVDTVQDELDGDLSGGDPAQAGPRLSLPEALMLAYYREGPQTILFDAERFPADRPAAISLSLHELPTVHDLCLDARNRGVVVSVEEGRCMGPPCMWHLGVGSLMIGLTITHTSGAMMVRGATVAGCRIATDGLLTFPGNGFAVLQLFGRAVLGPGNVIADRAQIFGGLEAATVVGNSIGYDPLTRQQLSNQPLLVLDQLSWDAVPGMPEVIVEHNLIAAGMSIGVTDDHLYPIRLRHNRIGVDPDGALLPEPFYGLAFHSRAQVWVGPGNIIRGVDTGIWVKGADDRVKALGNSIYDNGVGIAYFGQAPLGPPGIDEVVAMGGGRYRVNGRCDPSGIVELCEDRGDQCQVPVGQTACELGNGLRWSADVQLTPGWNLTATLSTDLDTSAFSPPVAIP